MQSKFFCGKDWLFIYIEKVNTHANPFFLAATMLLSRNETFQQVAILQADNMVEQLEQNFIPSF